MGNAFTFSVDDRDGLITAEVEQQIETCALYVISLVSRHLEWEGTLDFTVEIRPHSETPFFDENGNRINGIIPSFGQINENGVNLTLEECIGGEDRKPLRPDAGCTIYLPDDYGEGDPIRNYNLPVWFDPDPRFGVDPELPTGMADFVGIYTHEVFHSLGFWPGTTQWNALTEVADGISYFGGEETIALFGRPLPFDPIPHFFSTPEAEISSGLMYAVGNYERNRWDIDRISLAVLEDLGHTIKTYSGLPLFEFIDTDLELNGSSAHDRLFGDYHGNILRAGHGDDQLWAASGDDSAFGGAGNDLLYGEAGGDRLSGGDGTDLLDGGAGDDTMIGGRGNDIYRVDQANDSVREGAAEGEIDQVRASVDYALAAGVHVEILSTADDQGIAAIALAGNELDNRIRGNAGDNILYGLGGSDTLAGLRGQDMFVIDDRRDIILERAGEGTQDQAFTSVSYVLGDGAEVEILATDNHAGTEALNLTGNAFANILYGNDGANRLDGGGDADSMVGGRGHDVFIVENAGDGAFEFASGGHDRVESSVGFRLGAHIETLVLTGDGAIDGTGNALANVIVGNDGANHLNGGRGADTLRGGGGDDSYVVDRSTDRIVESAGGGVDTLLSAGSRALGGHVENLVLTGAADAAGSGSNGRNVLRGNHGDNRIEGRGGGDTLHGLAGDDRLAGGGGRDLLAGGDGADRFDFDTALSRTGNVDVILDFTAGADTILLDVAIFGAIGEGRLGADAFHLKGAGGDVEDRIVYDQASGRIFYDADGSGGGTAILFAEVAAGTTLTGANFVAYEGGG